MELEQRRLGRTGLYVSEIGLGGYQFTGEFGVHYDEADRIIDYALTHGVNYIDTAQMYGFGESEALVGRGLRRHADKTVYVSDKLGYIDRSVARAGGDAGYQDPVTLKRMIKHSLWLLQRDFVEIFMIHEPDSTWWQLDYDTGDSVATEALEELKREGVIGAIGLGCWNSEILARLCATGRFDVALNAGGINLLEAPMFDRLVTVAKEQDVGIVVGGVLGQGFAAELLEKDREYAGKLAVGEDEKLKVRGKKLLRLYDLADEAGMSMLEMAMRYVKSIPEIDCHIPGARCAEHIRENIAMYQKGKLSDDLMEAIVRVRTEY